MSPDGPDTIFAIASGFGRSAIAVMRISGPRARPALEALTGGRVPPPRVASLRRLDDPFTRAVLDQALVLWMPGPASFTGEDAAELHIHGGVAVRAAVVRALAEGAGLRPAEPGEFTRRAFLNARLDLSAVEGLADLIDAETEAQRRQALAQMEGVLARRVASWRERLVGAASLIAAALDFSDEEDVPPDLLAGIRQDLDAVAGEIGGELAGARRGERLREGFAVVIAGPPNAGKSTLLNAIARREVAIVSPHPGTTRDAIEIRCDLGGLPVSFIDTAGLRETDDPVEQAGIARARARAEAADLVLWLGAPDAPAGRAPGGGDVLAVLTKTDLVDAGPADGRISVSALSGAGMDDLLERVRDAAEAGLVGAADAVVTRERHRRALAEVAEALGRAGPALADGREELAAEDVRLALRALGRITGQVDVEEILDRVFAQFCIGK